MIIFLSLSAKGYSIKINKVEFTGNRFIKHPDKLFNIKINSVFPESIIKSWLDSLFSVYTANGFFWTTITFDTVKNPNQTILRFSVDEKKPAKIGTVDFIGNINFSASLLSTLLDYNVYFSNPSLQSQIDNILDFYADNGYPFAKIEPQNFSIDDKTISYQLNIAEGKEVLINQIKFTSNRTDEPQLIQILGLKIPCIYTKSKIKSGLDKIRANDIKINDYKLISHDTTFTLNIDITEEKHQEISGAVSYLPNSKELNGFFYLDLNNLFNTLRKVRLGWERYARFTNFDLNYQDPYLFGFILNGNFFYSVYDTFYAKMNFDIGASIPVLDYLSLGFSSGYEYINSAFTNLANYRTLWLGQGLSLVVGNNINPSYLMTLNTKLGTRTLHNQYLIITDLQNQLKLPFIHHTNFSFDCRLKNMYSNSELTIADSMYLGGTKTLRGYRENEFSTNRYILARNEFSFLQTQNLNTFVFDDLALFHKNNKYSIKTGYGIGMRTIAKIGTIGIDYGIPTDNNLLQGKIHLNFSNKF